MHKTLIVLLLFSSVSFADSCEDSDGGRNVKVKGTVIMTVGPKTQQFISREVDSCTKDDKSVIEYYCKNNQSITEVISCPNTCKHGACL